MAKKLEGLIVPIVTPFTARYELDESGLRAEIRFLAGYDIDGLLVNGSTGEFTSLSADERERIIRIVAQECEGKLFIIAGVETPSTQDAVEEAKRVSDAGADVALVATPYYLKPTTDGIYEHYKLVAEIGVPTMLYNNPFRTHVDLDVALVSRLTDLENVVGMKQSNVDLNQTAHFIEAVGERMALFHSYGDSVSLYPGLLMGGVGAMSITTHLAPERVIELYRATMRRDVEAAAMIWRELLPLLRSIGGGLQGEPNPAPLKEALRIVGRPAGPPRLPVLPATANTSEHLEKLLGTLEVDSIILPPEA